MASLEPNLGTNHKQYLKQNNKSHARCFKNLFLFCKKINDAKLQNGRESALGRCGKRSLFGIHQEPTREMIPVSGLRHPSPATPLWPQPTLSYAQPIVSFSLRSLAAFTFDS